MVSQAPLKIGVLGAARIAPFALLKHARALPNVEVVAVAEEYQGPEALARYARKHGIPRTHRSFDELLACADIDAVYIPLPISMHVEWTLRAIAAGKHVLCEKPMAANADEAARIADAAAGTGLVVCEAMHFRYHPLVARVRDILASGEIGTVRRIDASFSAFLPFDDFRFDYRLGGGGTIDMGCYPVGFVRAVTGEEPVVESAKAKLHGALIDRQMEATLRLPKSGAQVDMFVGMRCRRLLSVSMKIEGERGEVSILNFIKPEVFHRLSVKTEAGRRVERVPGGSTYRSQLAAFAESIRTGTQPVTTADDAVANMRVIDAMYLAAGLPVRGDAEVLRALETEAEAEPGNRKQRGKETPSPDAQAIPDLHGKYALVTGPTSGIGRGTALALGRAGATLILLARNPARCAEVEAELKALGAPAPFTILADLSLQREVRRAAEEILALGVPIDILVNNAGLVNQRRVLTDEGQEMTMAVNYFAPFALTLRLLPALRRARAARVINVTSNSYVLGRLDLDDLSFERFYWPLGPYSASKLGNIYFTRELARRLGPSSSITTHAVHPGLIFTNLGIGNNPGPLKQVLSRAWRLFSMEEAEGFRSPTYAATHPELEGRTGDYIADCQVTRPQPIALRDDAARALWKASEVITGVSWEPDDAGASQG